MDNNSKNSFTPASLSTEELSKALYETSLKLQQANDELTEIHNQQKELFLLLFEAIGKAGVGVCLLAMKGLYNLIKRNFSQIMHANRQIDKIHGKGTTINPLW